MLRTSVFIGDNASRDALYLGVHGNMTIYGEAVAAKVEEAAYQTGVARRERTDSDSEF